MQSVTFLRAGRDLYSEEINQSLSSYLHDNVGSAPRQVEFVDEAGFETDPNCEPAGGILYTDIIICSERGSIIPLDEVVYLKIYSDWISFSEAICE